MKYTAAALSLLSLAAANPFSLEPRQLLGGLLGGGGCKPVTLIFCRGTLEPSGLGWIIGPQFADALGKRMPNQIDVQPVDYGAGIVTNVLPGGGDPLGILDMRNKLNDVAQRCPQTKIVASGYSQGAAITHAAVAQASSQAKSRIAAVVLFGDTQAQQSRGNIQGIPKDRIKIICTPLDGVCAGTLLVGLTHLAYAPTAIEAVQFTVQKLDSFN